MRKPSNWQSFPRPSKIETRTYLTNDTDSDLALAQEMWATATGLGGLLTARRVATHPINKPKGERDYVYDPATNTYKDMTSGRVVTPQVMRRAVMKVSTEAQKRLREQTQQMMAGTIMFMVWYYRSRSILKALYKTIWALSIGGFLFDDQTQRDLFYAFLLLQFQRFDNFVDYLDNQPFFDGRILGRAGAYGRFGNVLYQNIKLSRGMERGDDQAIRLLGENENHCHDDEGSNRPGCVELADKGWMPINQMVPLGDATCWDNCYCTIETRRNPMFHHHMGGVSGHDPHPDGSPQSVHGGGKKGVTYSISVETEHWKGRSAEIRTRKEYDRLIQRYPKLAELLKDHPVQVKIVEKDLEEGGGVYHFGDDEILLNPVVVNGLPGRYGQSEFIVDGSIDGLARHELAHHFDHHSNRPSDGLYADLVFKEMRSKGMNPSRHVELKEYTKSIISEYGGMNMSESFAEGFTMYTHPRYGENGKPTLPPALEAFYKEILGA